MKHLKICVLTVALLLTTLCAPLTVSARVVNGGQMGEAEIKAYGCDLSFWNVGGYYPDYSMIDFEKMKADGCDFVILRVGFEGTSTRENAMDTAFLSLYEAAKAAGLDVGAYFYALATTYEGAAEDAQWCIDLFEAYDLSFEYPIYYDVEDPGDGGARPGHGVLTAEETTALCLGWAETLRAAGYYPGLYGIHETVEKLLPAYTSRYDVWLAYVAYAEGTPEFVPERMDQSPLCGMWQYSWKGSFDGAVNEIDVDVAYKDYPAIMRKNGYNNVEPVWEEDGSLMPSAETILPYDYNEAGEGIVPSFAEDGTVTLVSNVASGWAWPSAYVSCYKMIDLNETPLLSVSKSGTSHFNAVLSFESDAGTVKTVTLASVTNEANGEYDAGAMEITVNMADYLRKQELYPTNGVLKLLGVTYYIMGAKGAYTLLEDARFTASPLPTELTSSVYTIDTDNVSRVPAPMTLEAFLSGLDQTDGVVVRDLDGQRLAPSDEIVSGMIVAIEHNDAALRTYTLSLIGDVNADGEASTMDARRILGGLLGGEALSPWQLLSADFDGDGEANTADVRELLRSVLA